MSNINIINVNYVILTRDQFATDYPKEWLPSDGGHVLALHDDDDKLLVAIWGSGKYFAAFTADLAKYAASQADPGVIEAKVGRNVTELAGSSDTS